MSIEIFKIKLLSSLTLKKTFSKETEFLSKWVNSVRKLGTPVYILKMSNLAEVQIPAPALGSVNIFLIMQSSPIINCILNPLIVRVVIASRHQSTDFL